MVRLCLNVYNMFSLALILVLMNVRVLKIYILGLIDELN
jgi:hypothetical protein